MVQEGIEADDAVLSVLAQAGEGSVRDSLSALDQAIACCGTTLKADELRALLGMFSLESLGEVSNALTAADSRRMLDIVLELESNGRSLQHFSRELARYFRNLLVVKISGVGTKLVAGTPEEQSKLSETAARFSEEDLTRYLQLSLDLFKDLQSSLQPRLHLEIGLLRMVHAGKLQSIEQALSSLGSGSSTPPAPKSAPSGAAPVKMSAPPTATPSNVAPPRSAAPSGDLRTRLHAALLEAKQLHLADAIEHSEIAEAPGELVVTTPKMYLMYLKQPDFETAARRLSGAAKITIKAGDPAPAPVAVSAPAPAVDEASTRALAHPEVQRFQETFPDSQVRTVRNLREN
jgi:DNA polymerase-3 subunit gamma/tau